MESFQCINKGAGSITLKIDVRKAFDTKRWPFLLHVLECLGFEQQFRDLVSSILRSGQLSISINGKLEGFFSCLRGVRQGDLLSPLLFAIGEEVLAKLITYKELKSNLGVTVPTSLFYADNIMIFCMATKKNVQLIRDIFLSSWGIFWLGC